MMVEDEITSRRREFSAGQRALLEKRLRGAGKNTRRPPVISRRPPGAGAPLSFAQQRLWFFDQLEPASPLYNMPVALRLRGNLNRGALQKAIAAMVARHEALRTRFESVDGNPVQVIAEPSPVEWNVVDLSQRQDELREWLNTEAKQPFDLSRDQLLRVSLARLGEADHVLLIVMHHIISDAWSLNIFFRELSIFYEAFSEGSEITPPVLPLQYADFAAWQRARLRGEALEKELTYWKKQLAGAPPFLDLPVDKLRPPIQSFRGGRAERLLPKALAEALKRLGQAKGATLYMTLLAAFKVLLHRYTRQTDLVVGSPIAGRNRLETEGLIGFFVNTLALRTDLSGNPAFSELLMRVRQTVLDGVAHQELPFEKLVEALQPARSPGHAPLTQVMFILQTGTERESKLPGLAVEPMTVSTDTAKFDLTLAVEEWPDGLCVQVEYNADLFNEETLVRALGHYATLLEGIVANPSQNIGSLPLLANAEQDQILFKWSGAKTDYPRGETISELFEEQVEKTPDAVAVMFGNEQLTYRRLNERANQLADHLQRLSVECGMMVAVCLERSWELIVALLGVLKAGGVYVALQPSQPKERLALMLEDAPTPVLLTQESLREHFNFQSSNFKLVCLDTEWNFITQRSVANPVRPTGHPQSAAYVCFTSGSTGEPKGVAVPHRGVVRLVKETDYAHFGADETFLQLAPISFDASTFEIWGALLNGARLVVFPPRIPSLSELGEFIQQNKITTLWLTAGLFHQMVEEQIESLKNVRQLLAGGDVLSVPHVKRALQHLPGCKLINGYGPTENTTFTCCHPITPEDCARRSIPIGRPIANAQVYVLDDYLQPVPMGVPGELHAGGDGLALGYLNQSNLTAEKFIRNPFGDGWEARLYKTGDLVRWLPDGTIEFLGRVDRQVKIRGFRVELGEIETALNEHPAVRDCAVKAWGELAGRKQLAAYFVADFTARTDAETLRAYLRKKLPDYMVPTAFVPLPSLPLNGNGKVDREALPPPERPVEAAAKKFIAPRDEWERKLAKIWEEVLEIRHVGMEDPFFELGGHSLLAVRLVARIEKEFAAKIPVATVFQSPTIAQLADVLRHGKQAVGVSSVVEIQPNGSRPPLFFVHGVGGGMFWGYTNLSRHLGNDQPVLAFKSRGMDGREEFATIEEMAAQYVADLQARQPRGPYFLGGYCFGGNVAYEMARQLETRGEKIALLALMNCAPPNSSYARHRWTPRFCLRFIGNFFEIAAAAMRDNPEQRRAFFLWMTRGLKKTIVRLFGRKFRRQQESDVEKFVEEIEESLDLPAEARPLWKVHLRALITYRPQPYGGRVTLFRSRCHPPLCSFDPQYGWGEFAGGGVMVKIVPGNHESILNERHARAVAEAMRECLREVETSNESPPDFGTRREAASHAEAKRRRERQAAFDSSVNGLKASSSPRSTAAVQDAAASSDANKPTTP
jgi:amino acid adenylation domain-containing protein